MNLLLAIDPGASGGIAYITPAGRIVAMAMPDTETEIVQTLRGIVRESEFEGIPHLDCVIEKVGGFTGEGQPGSAMFKFGRGVGILVGAMVALEIPFREIRPQTWQAQVGAGTRGTRTKPEWKRHLADLARKRFPDVKVTLSTADALLMLAASFPGAVSGRGQS